jgi:sorbitol-specific phosphotransferase system component IIA
VVDPSALHLAIAAFFAPLQNQAFVSTVDICEYDQVMIGFSDRAPQDLGEKMAQELSEIPATLMHSGLTLDLSSLNSRAQIRAVGSQVEEILIATGSTATSLAKPVTTGTANFSTMSRRIMVCDRRNVLRLSGVDHE